MSVRRLAEEAVQPTAFAFNRSNAAWAKRKLKDYPKGREASAVIPLLMRAQEQDGWVTRAAIEHVAEFLDMPLIRVLEVATFYTQFQLAPVGKRAHIQVCGTTPCMLRGSGDLMDVCKRKISPNQFEVTADGHLSWEEVECQGTCVNAPMVMIFKDTYEDLTPERLEEIIDAFEAGKGKTITPGPQIERTTSAPEGGPTTLTEAPGKKSPSKGRKKASPQAATSAGRPASHATMTSPAVKTPVSKEKSKEAKNRAESARGEAKAASAKTSSAKSAAKPNLKDSNRPAAIKKPKKVDDLKLISGVGPKIEGILHGLGIYTFAQVAEWKKAEREWVDGYLRFKGRIDRDDWTKQAKALAKGGRDEYVRVFGKEPR